MKKIKFKKLLALMLFVPIIACNQGASDGEVNISEASANPSGEKELGQAGVIDEDSEANILNIAISSESHSTLVAGVQAADIEHVLVNAGPLTVFAPTNAGFDKLPVGTLENLLKKENKSQLANILKLHAAPGNYDQAALAREASKGRKIFMASGDYLEVVEKDGKIYVAGIEVLQSIKATNGIIHVIDDVILPKKG